MKKRLDVLLVERGLAESRAQAQALVLAGLVPGYDKPGQPVAEDAELEVQRRPRFVSRGARSSRTPSSGRTSSSTSGTQSTSAPRPAASPTICSNTASVA